MAEGVDCVPDTCCCTDGANFNSLPLDVVATAAIAEYEYEYRQSRTLIEHLEAALAEARVGIDAAINKVKCAVMELGESVALGSIKATYRRPSVRVKWNTKGLDGYIIAHPEVGSFRSESSVKGSVSIKVVG